MRIIIGIIGVIYACIIITFLSVLFYARITNKKQINFTALNGLIRIEYEKQETPDIK